MSGCEQQVLRRRKKYPNIFTPSQKLNHPSEWTENVMIFYQYLSNRQIKLGRTDQSKDMPTVRQTESVSSL